MRSVLTLVATSALTAAIPAMAAPEPPAQTVTPAAPLTLQQQFDAGGAAMQTGDWTKALEAATAKKSASKILSVIRLRKGRALSKLGRTEEAEPILSEAISHIPPDDTNLIEDRQEALAVLGVIAEIRFDYAGAISRYREAFNTAPADGMIYKLNSLSRLIPVEMFVDSGAALRDADLGLSLIVNAPAVNKEWPGNFHALRGRVLLNQGRIKEARTEFKMAISLLGRLGGGRINLLDASARSDASIAALIDNDPNAARELLAYSGAAQQSQQQFRLGSDMEPPGCAVNGPRPEDVAVVELSIGENGGVTFARTVYFSGKPAHAVDFAKAVAGWSWTPAELKQISLFFRVQSRIELRCTTVFARPYALTMLEPAFAKWKQDRGILPIVSPEVSDAHSADSMRAELARREAQYGAKSLQLIPVLVALFRNANVTAAPSEVFAQRALDIAKLSEIPAQPLVYLEVSRWQYYFVHGKSGAEKFGQEIDAALNDPKIASDPQATSALRMVRFDTLPRNKRQPLGYGYLQAVLDDKKLQPNDPFRVGALTRLANLDYRAGRIEEARTHFQETGLSTQQCALVDSKPLQVAGRLSAGDYPEAARDWGFSGWTVIEFDIAADGHAFGHRAIASFPPFVFGPPVIKGMQRFRYEQTYRPGGGTGCGGMRYAPYFKFVLP